MISISEQQLELFMSLFRGRTDVYARRWEKDGRSGYSPAYDFNWDEFMTHKRRGGSMKDFENKKLIPLTKEVVEKHLSGQHIVGIYPILPDNTSYFIAADFDGENWLKDSRLFLQACKEVGLSAYLERSRSGNGGHVWIFFSENYPCYKSRQIALELIRKVFNVSEFEKEVSFDRLFPNQDALTRAGFGNLIALPLQALNYETPLKRSQLTPRLIHFLKEELNFLNTEYLTKRRLGKSIYKVQKYFKLIDETADFISLPRGFLQNIIAFLKENKAAYTIRFNIPNFEQTSYQSEIKLTSAQAPIVQTATECDQGVIVAPSGSGKTIIGLELVARRQLPTLILVHRKQLLDQWIERTQTFLGIAKAMAEQWGCKPK